MSLIDVCSPACRSGQDGDAGDLGRNLVDQALEQIGHGGVHDGEDSCADNHNDENLHGHIEVAFTGLVNGQVLHVPAQRRDMGRQGIGAAGLQGNHLGHGHYSISVFIGR